jgi:hypothetical protein
MTLAAICVFIVYPSLPVNYFTASSRGKIILASPAPNAYPFFTEYAHSFQLTPVIDDYRLVNGKIWGWEERTQPRGAAPPSLPSPNPRLTISPPWMIIRGRRNETSLINYRVGNARFGRDLWRFDPWDTINIFEIYPLFSLSLESGIVPFKEAPVRGFDTIHAKPDMSRIFSM